MFPKITPFIVIILFAGLPSVLSADATKPTGKPNVLFILADDLCVRSMTGPQAHTPNLDRLRIQGVSFLNAQCAAPLCGPSRACLLTGLQAHTTRWYGWGQNPAGMKNWKEWHERPVIADCTVWPQHFARNGYDVFGTGKIGHGMHKDRWMFENSDGKTQWGFVPVSQGPWPSDGVDKAMLKRTGKEWIGSAAAPEYMPDPMQKVGRWFAPLSRVPNIPPDAKAGTTGYHGWCDTGKPFRYVSETDRDLMTDEKSTRYAIQVLKQKHDRPFLIAVGLCKPHEPLVAPQKYFDLYKDRDIMLPPYREDDLVDCAKALYGNTIGERVFQAVRASGDGFWKEYYRGYLACVAFMDDQIGQILDALAQSPYANNTIIIFAGDNGYHNGEKSMINKMTVWNESTRVPLIVRVPALAASEKSCPHPVSLVDLYPTLIDLCGLPRDPNGKKGLRLDGHSLRPFLENPEHGTWDGPDVALTAWMGKPTTEQRADCLAPAVVKDQHFTVCSERYRYILANSGEEELYDHESDPNEWTNRAADPALASVKAGLRSQLLRLIGESR